MRGLLADVNVQGHLTHVVHALKALDLTDLLDELGLRLATFRDVGLDPGIDDRRLWAFYQREAWVFFTENRNEDGPDSHQRTIEDSWTSGHLPVLTLANKRRYEADRLYRMRAAEDIAELLFGIASGGQYRDQPRTYIPLHRP